MAVALDLLFDPFIVMLVGPEYAFGSFSFRLILAAHLLIPIYTVANYELAVNGRTKTIGATTLIAAAIYMPLNGYLVPVFGIEGAAIATFVTYFLLAVVTNLLVQLSGGVCWRYLGFVGSCLGLMGVLMAVQYWSEGNVLLRICLSSFVFMILVVMLGKQYMGFKAAIS